MPQKLMTDGIDSLLFGDFIGVIYKEMAIRFYSKSFTSSIYARATGQILKQTIQGNTFKIDCMEAKNLNSKFNFLPYTKKLKYSGKGKV